MKKRKEPKRIPIVTTWGYQHNTDERVLEEINYYRAEEGEAPIDSIEAVDSDTYWQEVNHLQESDYRFDKEFLEEIFDHDFTAIAIGEGPRIGRPSFCIQTVYGSFADIIYKLAEDMDDFELYIENGKLFMNGSCHDGGFSLEIRLLKDAFEEYSGRYLLSTMPWTRGQTAYYTKSLVKHIKEYIGA